MFTKNEIDALLLGSQWVSQFGDAPLSKAATDALHKIRDVLPSSIKNTMNTFMLRVGPPASEQLMKEDLSVLREAIAHQKKIAITYASENDSKIQRVIWPFTLGYFTECRILVAWCEKQHDYRHFKTDNLISLEVLNERYPRARESLFQEWQAAQLQKYAVYSLE